MTTETGIDSAASTATSSPARVAEAPARSRKNSANQPNATYACSDCDPKNSASDHAVTLPRSGTRTRAGRSPSTVRGPPGSTTQHAAATAASTAQAPRPTRQSTVPPRVAIGTVSAAPSVVPIAMDVV